MNKKLTAKVQQLNAQPIFQGDSFSSCIVVEPEEKEQVLKKGVIYGVFDLASSEEIDTNLIKTILNDALKESYFQSDSISPIQSLEKAIIDVKEKVTHVIIKNPEQKLSFNILTGVLWGNVLYVVQFGEGSCFLVRQGEIKPINTMSEGSFSAASGVVKDEDVVIFSTKKFAEKYPPNKLLSMAIPEQGLEPQESCALLKFIVDTSFSENEIVDFGLEESVVKRNKVKDLFGKISDKVGPAQIKKAFSKSKEKQETEQTTSIRLKSIPTPKIGLKYAIPVVFVALLISVFFTLKNKNSPSKIETQPTANQEENTNGSATPEVQASETSNEGVFYDLKIVDLNAQPNEIVLVGGYVLVSERGTGKLYISSTDTPKFEAVEGTYSGINSLKLAGTEIFFADNEGYKFYDPSKRSITNNYKTQSGNISATYLGYVYAIKSNEMLKYTPSESALQEANWGTSDDFKDAKSMSVAYSIFLLNSNGEVVVYTSGNKGEFEITGLETPLSNPNEVVTYVDFENVYVSDSGNKRVVVLEKDGKFVKEIKSTTGKDWDDLKNIGVSDDEKKMFVLSGSKVYEVSL